MSGPPPGPSPACHGNLHIDVVFWSATEAHDCNHCLAVLGVHIEVHAVGKLVAAFASFASGAAHVKTRGVVRPWDRDRLGSLQGFPTLGFAGKNLGIAIKNNP